MITVAFFYWRDPKWRTPYSVEHVNVLRRQVDRNLSLPHEFVCITNDVGFDSGIRSIPLDRRTFIDGARWYAKLMVFHPNASKLIGQRILLLDLDAVVTGSLDGIAKRSEDLVLWRNPNWGRAGRTFYNSSIVLVSGGSRPEIWNDWSEAEITRGGDQEWLSRRCSMDEAHWTDADGIYGSCQFNPGKLPKDARIVFFAGKREPGQKSEQLKHPWIAEHRH